MVSYKKSAIISQIYFSLCDLDMQWPGTIIEEGHTGIIQVKFGQNPVSNLGDVL